MTITGTKIFQRFLLHYQSFAVPMIIANTHWRFRQ